MFELIGVCASTDFCDKCVAINPNDAKDVKSKIVFSTGCKNGRCIADLKVTNSLQYLPM